ncbi:MAG: tetratricopeptide repeat protein [Candidatus Acidiferrum sp.]
MPRISRMSAILLLCVSLWFSSSSLLAQAPKSSSTSAASSAPSEQQAAAFAKEGRCKEALPGLQRALNSSGSPESKKDTAILGLRCSLNLDNRESALDFLHFLGHQFPHDPEVLFIVVHAYSDLSTRTAQDLGRTAPQSVAAHKLNAEALEMQGKWDEAQREYEAIIEKYPDTQGIHYLLGRLLLSRPDADNKFAARAKEEFEKELQLDPHNAGAEFILGEMAQQDSQWDDAIAHYTRATKLNVTFGDAYMSLGFCLVTQKRYEEAIAPLRVAVRLQQGNPAAHYNLAVALSRTGNKDEAEKEFALQRQLTQTSAPADQKPQ